ncbi:MAG: hypothetical protein JRJ00_00170 [Deltaproteobacteria bacterium]|nr:hypothetical protein [Deltaproteobacteria bacterium]
MSMLSTGGTSSGSYNCHCNHTHSDIYKRLSKLEESLKSFTEKKDIIFEQKQEIERLNGKLDEIGRTLKPLFEKKEITE